MHWHLHKDARRALPGAESAAAGTAPGRMEVAVAIGTDPAVTYAATAPLPGRIDEMLFAGFLRGEAVELVQCRTVDLRGAGPRGVRARGLRGPRRDAHWRDRSATTPATTRWPTTIRCSTSPPSPTAATPSTPPPSWARRPWRTPIWARPPSGCSCRCCGSPCPELVDMDLPKEGGFHNCALVSVDKRYPLHARKVMHALWGTGQMQFCKCIVVVDARRGRARLRPGGLAGVQQRRLEAGRDWSSRARWTCSTIPRRSRCGAARSASTPPARARGGSRPGVAARRGDVAGGEGPHRRVVARSGPGRPAAAAGAGADARGGRSGAHGAARLRPPLRQSGEVRALHLRAALRLRGRLPGRDAGARLLAHVLDHRGHGRRPQLRHGRQPADRRRASTRATRAPPGARSRRGG